MIQIQDIYDSFGRFKRDVTDVEVGTFLEWVQFAGRFIYNRVKSIDPERFMEEEAYTVSTSPQTSSLPTEFKDLTQTGCGIYYVVNGEDTDREVGPSKFGRSSAGYYLKGSSIVFTGLEGQSVKMRYIPKPPVFTDFSEYFSVDTTVTGMPLVEDEHLEFLVKAIDVLYSAWDEDMNLESVADFRMVRALGDVLTQIDRAPKVYEGSDTSLNF